MNNRVNIKCVGRGCYIKETCLRYVVYNENKEEDSFIIVSVNACNGDRSKPMLLKIKGEEIDEQLE